MNLQWVKAETRMPDNGELNKIVHIKPVKDGYDFYMFLKYIRDWDVKDTPTFRWNLWDGYHGWTRKITPDLLPQIEWLSESPSSIEGGEKMFTKEDLQDAFDAGHDRGSYSAGGCDVMGVGYSPSFREWFEKEHPDKLSAKEIKDANESENWHPQDYSGKNAPSPALPIKEEEKRIAVEAIWKAIEHFQGARLEDDACEDRDTWSDKVLSYNEVESELYDVLEQIDPSAKEPPAVAIEQEKKWDDKTDGEKLNEVCPIKEVVCPACGGDGKETCDNPDHGFIEAMPGETGRLGCPVCGHDPNHKVNKGRNTCPLCGGLGHVIYEVADEYGRETGYDEEFIHYSPSAPTSTAIDQPKDQGEIPFDVANDIYRMWKKNTQGFFFPPFQAGAIAIYRKMLKMATDANARYSDTILDLRRAQTENTALQSKIEALERERDELKVKVKEQGDWINSHL
jgi:hypothetical protein